VAIQPLVPQKLAPEDAWGATPEDLKWCKERLSQIRAEGIFTPPSERGSLIIPGNVGGVNWGGVAYDPERGLAIAATNRVPFVVTLVPRDQLKPGDNGPMVEIASMKNTPYALRREPLMTPRMTLCNPPPWGALSAVDLSTGKLRWEVPLGVMPEIAHLPSAARLGSINLGGPITTAGGLVFIGAARDNYLRAFDSDTGKELWKFELPASAQATPMAYEAGGKQYVVIAAGGHGKLGTKLGDSLVAFSLP
jgi:quinoprotein glucose dehydrogenase